MQAGIRIQRDGDAISFLRPRDWTRAGEASLVLFLVLAAVLAALCPSPHFALLLIGTIFLPLWIAATARWQPIHWLRRKLTVRWPERSYRDSNLACEVSVDGRLLDVRQVRYVCIGVATIRGRYAPLYGIYVVSTESAIFVTETREADQALSLAQIIQVELTPDLPVYKVNGRPSPGWGAGCFAPLAAAVLLLGVYLVGVALTLRWPIRNYEVIELAPERAKWLAPATAVLLVVVASAGRLAAEGLFRQRTRAAFRELFGRGLQR